MERHLLKELEAWYTKFKPRRTIASPLARQPIGFDFINVNYFKDPWPTAADRPSPAACAALAAVAARELASAGSSLTLKHILVICYVYVSSSGVLQAREATKPGISLAREPAQQPDACARGWM